MEEKTQRSEIPNHVGYYADMQGNIYNSKGSKLIPQTQGNYVGVDLPIGNGKFKRFGVHRLIAITFIPNPENKPQVNHKDGDKHNNSVTNLEWVTRSENQKHRFCELHHSHFGEKNTQAKLTEAKVRDIVKFKHLGLGLGYLSDMFSVSKQTICDIMAGRSWSHVTGIPPKRNIKRMKELDLLNESNFAWVHVSYRADEDNRKQVLKL